MINENLKRWIIGDGNNEMIDKLQLNCLTPFRRWFICHPDGTIFDDHPYKTATAAKAALTRLKKDYKT